MYYKELQEYYFDRDTFVRVVLDAARAHGFKDDEKICLACEEDIYTSNFKFFKCEDTYFIVHLDSGTMIGWYKHLGRCNVCTEDFYTEKELFDYFYAAFEEVKNVE